ncbi:MAG: tetratricopeptide repeat protein [Acidobacteriota bacterium]
MSIEADATRPKTLPRVLPVVLLYHWSIEGQDDELQLAEQHLDELPGVEALTDVRSASGGRLYAFLPIPGDAGEADSATGCALQLLRRCRSARGAQGAASAFLLLPGSVHLRQGRCELVPEALLDDLLSYAPRVPMDEVYLTGYAASRLAKRWPTAPQQEFRGQSGSRANLYRLDGRERALEPWRNPELLGLRPEYVPRPTIEQAILGRSGARVLRLVGPLGSGKTRIAWQTFGCDPAQRRKKRADHSLMRTATPVWVTVPPLRSQRSGVAARILEALVRNHAGDLLDQDPQQALASMGLEPYADWLVDHGEEPDPAIVHEVLTETLRSTARRLGEPVRLILDDVPNSHPSDIATIDRLIAEPVLEDLTLFVLLGRRGARWSPIANTSPEVSIPAMARREMEVLADGLTSGLSMPEEVKERFLQASDGIPFAFEEGLIKLIHRNVLRRIYGSFFFNGSGQEPYLPSSRFVQHLEAENLALGGGQGLQLLATASLAMPAREISAAAELLGAQLSTDWEVRLVHAGWLTQESTPWGIGVRFTSDAFEVGLRETMIDEEGLVRQAAGEILAHASDAPLARWHAYQLLSGSAAAVPPILELAQSHPQGLEPDEILDALAEELSGHQRREGNAEIELQLLWILLPLARRLGRLEAFEAEIDRALELADGEPRKYLAFAGLRSEVDLAKGRLEDSERVLRQALELVVEEDPGRQALLLLQLVKILIRRERYDEARSLLEQLLPLLESRGSRTQVASCWYYLGNIALRQRRLKEAMEHHRKAFELRHRVGNLKALGASLSALGATSLARGNYAKSLGFYKKAKEFLEDHGDPGEVSFALLGIGRVLHRLGDGVGAQAHLKRSLKLREEIGDTVGAAIAELNLAANWLLLGRTNEAMTTARRAHFTLQMMPESETLGDAEQLIGRIHLRQRNALEAAEHLRNAREIHQRHNNSSSGLVDLSYELELALNTQDAARIPELCHLLEQRRETLDPAERQELLDLRLYRGLEWVHRYGIPGTGSIRFLRLAYRELMRKAGFLDPALRNVFLFQVPENAEILDAATDQRLTFPEMPLRLMRG